MFKYICSICGSPAKKEPCKAPKPGAGSPATGTLGSWRCAGRCPGKVKVRRERA